MKVLLPGSYDPCTVGHLAVIEKAAALYEKVIVGIFINPDKQGLFTHSERLSFLSLATAHLSNVTVDFSDGYVADYAKEKGISLIIKGIRNENDRAYEEEMAAYNERRGGVKTLLWQAEDALCALSSTEVRRALAEGRDIGGLVPKAALAVILAAYAKK